MTVVDRLDGINSGLGIKAPVRVATTADIVLSGLQTIDGVALGDGDRVLVKDQSDASLNGIYNASSGNWRRALDFDGPRDIAQGTTIVVSNGTTWGNSFWKIVTANPAIGAPLVFGRITSDVGNEVSAAPSVAASFVRTIHADAYSSLAEAIADLGENERLLLRGGATYSHSAGALTVWPDNFALESDNGTRATIDFSGNSAWHPSGLMRFEGSVDADTEQELTGDLVADNADYLPMRPASGSASGQTCTLVFSRVHNLSNGDLIFIRFGDSTTDGQSAYCTEMPSDEGQALHKPVAVTVIDPNTISYEAYAGTPDALLTIFPTIYRNNQFIPIANTSDFAAGDLVHLTSDATYSGYTGNQTINEAELNKVAFVVSGEGLFLQHAVEFSFLVSDNATVAKVNPKRPQMRRIAIIGKGYKSNKTTYAQSDTGIYETLVDQAVYEDVVIENCDFVSHCSQSTYLTTLERCVSVKDERDAAGRLTGKIDTQYGFSYGNAMRGYRAIDCVAIGGRHGFDEYSREDVKGRIADVTLVRPVCINQWSTNIDTHDMYKRITILSPYINGGKGIRCRNGGVICTDIIAENVDNAFRAYGRVVDITTSVLDAKNIYGPVVYFTPTGTGTPAMSGVRVPFINARRVDMGLRVDLPANLDGRLEFGDISLVDVFWYAVYVSAASGAVMRSLRGGSVVSINNTGATVVFLNSTTDSLIDYVYGESSGNLTLVNYSGAVQERNYVTRYGGKSGGTLTPFIFNTGTHADAPVTKTADFSLGVTERVVVNNKSGSACVVTLPSASGNAGRIVRLINAQAQALNSALSNVIPLGGGSAGANILPPIVGSWADITPSGSSWRVIASSGGLVGSKTYDPGDLSDGAGETTTVTVTGAALGDFARASFSLDLQGVLLTAWVSSADTVSVRFQNESGGSVNLDEGTLSVRVEK